jgi:integrase
MAKCGLRVGETVNVRPDDIINSSKRCPHVRVESYNRIRDVPLPCDIHSDIQNYLNEYEVKPTESIIHYSKRTVSRWVKEASEECYEETGDKTWLDISARDLRTSWVKLLLLNGVPQRKIKEISGLDIQVTEEPLSPNGIEQIEWYSE